MSDYFEYENAVQTIKNAILQSQYQAARSVNSVSLGLYYGVGGFISTNTRRKAWGTGAIEAISQRLQKELPGLRGFTPRNMRFMRTFFEEWHEVLGTTAVSASNYELASSKNNAGDELPIWNLQVPDYEGFPRDEFMSLGFTHHRWILSLSKDLDERLFYIRYCARQHLSVEALKRAIRADDYHHQGALPNNFEQALGVPQQALRAISMFKDEYLLDFINVEELGARDAADVDERVVEQAIVHNVKNFIMTFGRAFTFVGNQYHLDAFGEDQYIDLLFFNRDLNCLVAVELKSGPFKTAYLGQLSGYLSILNGFERRPHENPPIGLILCKDMNKAFVDYLVQDYKQPLGVATYKTSKDMSEELLRALPPIEDLERLLTSGGE